MLLSAVTDSSLQLKHCLFHFQFWLFLLASGDSPTLSYCLTVSEESSYITFKHQDHKIKFPFLTEIIVHQSQAVSELHLDAHLRATHITTNTVSTHVSSWSVNGSFWTGIIKNPVTPSHIPATAACWELPKYEPGLMNLTINWNTKQAGFHQIVSL